MMTPARLDGLIRRFPSRRIAVIGDFFLDKYLDVEPAIAEVSLETGLRANQVIRIRHSPGAAGTVVNNLAALGTGTLYAVGYVGEDGEAFDLLADLRKLGCRAEYLLRTQARMTPTYLKPRDATAPGLKGEHERYDTQNRTPTSRELEDAIIRNLDAVLPRVHAVIVMDQVEKTDGGVVTGRVRRALADRARRWSRVIFWADSRARIGLYRSVIIKPNQFEAAGKDHPRPGERVDEKSLVKAVRRLRVRHGAPIVCTRGPLGMLVSDPEPTFVPGVRVQGPVDPTGAGDSATAGAVLALASGATLPEAALVGNLVASITVQQLATTGVATPEEVRERLQVWIAQQKDPKAPAARLHSRTERGTRA